MKISGVDIRPGNILEYERGIWKVAKIQHTQPGKGGAYMQVEMKNLQDGRKTNVRFRSADTVERVRLERLACAILIRMRTCVDVLVLLFGARVERIAQILILVFERLERLDHRQGIERRAFLRLLLRDPLAQVVARRAAGERGHDKREARQTERDGHLRAHQPPPFFGAAAGAGFFGGMPFFVGFAAA